MLLELAPKDSKACDELQALAALVFNMQSISKASAKDVQTLSITTRRI
jgi:hypothetical protein